MVSAGAGVSQQGQNQVSMDAQTCLACKSNWCTTWPQEVNAHVHGRLMAEYPTPRLVWVKRTTLSVSQGRSRRENYASHERLYSFISVRIPVSQRSCQAALYGNEQNLRDEWNWVQNCDIFSAARCCACQPGLVQVSKVWGYHLTVVNKLPETLLHNHKVKLITTNKVLNDGLIDSKITAA